MPRRASPLWVMGDADRLKQLALILLDNAVKYTPPEGHIWVIVRQERGMVELRVMDNGPGIPAERLPHLFDRFYRGGTLARGRDDGGAGLGLAIAREIAQGYGGTIAVESTVGQGTAFTVQFPLLTPAEPYRPADLPTASIPTPVATLKRRREPQRRREHREKQRTKRYVPSLLFSVLSVPLCARRGSLGLTHGEGRDTLWRRFRGTMEGEHRWHSMRRCSSGWWRRPACRGARSSSG